MQVGFIGLGHLGITIARKIAQSGFPLAVYDINPAAMEAFGEPITEKSADPIALARRCDVVCVCVRMDADLADLAGDGRLFEALGDGGIFIVHSTVAPELCQELEGVAKRYGVSLIDAGVSGGTGAAARGELSIYVGGPDAAIDKVAPLLDSYGKVARMGPVGRGMQGKLLNNFLAIANYGLAAATLEVGERLGFDRAQLHEALLQGSASSFGLRVVNNVLRPDGAAAMHQLLGKDVDHARHLAPGTDADMVTLASAAQSLLDRLERTAARAG